MSGERCGLGLGWEEEEEEGQGSDGLLVGGDEALHAHVPYHEVGRTSVLVDEQSAAASLERLDDRGRLG